MVVAGPAGHALMQSKRALPLAQLRGQPLVLYKRPAGPGLHDGIVAACVGAGFHPQVVQEAPRLTATLSLVAAGLGLSIVPASLQQLRGDGLAYRRLSAAPGLVAPLILVSQRRPEAQARVLLQHLGSILDQELAQQRARKGVA
jgi:DNA-binding transcriptional LysR family regulator